MAGRAPSILISGLCEVNIGKANADTPRGQWQSGAGQCVIHGPDECA
jgi:hypothetical protein